MTQAITENINSMLKYRGRIFYTLLFGIIFLAIAYIVLVRSAIGNVVEREKVIKEIREKSTTVSELESNYFSMKSKINIELAHSKGFQDSEVSSFISKKPVTAFVSYNGL